MHQVNIHEAKSQLSRLIDEAVKGESFIIAKAGKPLVIVKRIDAPKVIKRMGFLEGQFNIPDDFDTLGQEDIDHLFDGNK